VTQRDVVDYVVRRFTDNGCQVTSVGADGARQFTWHVVTADGSHLCADGVPLAIDFEGHAVYALTTLVEEGRREAARPPDDNAASPRQ
jgi:hypothetical protein